MQQREMISLPAEAARPPPHQQGRGGQRPGQLRPRGPGLGERGEERGGVRKTTVHPNAPARSAIKPSTETLIE
jgi:hypothetical protein